MKNKNNTYDNLDVNTLILLCRQHDDDAFDELVRRYTPMICNVVSGFNPSECDDEELFAEGCVALHDAAQSYNIDSEHVTFGLYARICVHNRIIDWFRRADHKEHISEVDVEQMSDEESLEDSLVSREMFMMLLKAAKGHLSEYEYRVLVLHIQGYKTAQIATALGTTAKSVDNAKSRLFRKLRREIGDISQF
ncbi:MAG: sigma-70 family RNA polymerase sigma factor [Clostridia bacterium]|nr:sigma-70 family RNA polymerase sigma factor [Clostridia bacterium]